MIGGDEMHSRLKPLLIALMESDLTDEQIVELRAILREDLDAKQYFARYMFVHGALAWRDSPPLVSDDDKDHRFSKMPRGKGSPPVRLPKRIMQFFSRTTPLSLTVAAAVMALIVTVMALMAPPFYRAIVHNGGDNRPSSGSQAYVAQLTGLHNSIWAGDAQAPPRGVFLQRGRQMELRSGVAEVTFAGGAKVTLEAPARWVVVDRGTLQIDSGQLVAEVPPRAVGFVVRTPASRIVDLGTNFGVKSTADATDVHVFQGQVEATFFATDGQPTRTERLAAGESVSWSAHTEQMQRKTADQAAFVSTIPRRETLPPIATGQGMEVGQPDPNWTIVSADADAGFEPQAAVATALRKALPNDIQRSQWISNSHPAVVLAGEATYTFRTTFTVEGFDPESVRLVGRFAVDNLVTSIRVNGTELPVPDHEYGFDTFRQFIPLEVTRGFVSGENTLEFDVDDFDDGGERMAFRLELFGSAVRQVERGTTELDSPQKQSSD